LLVSVLLVSVLLVSVLLVSVLLVSVLLVSVLLVSVLLVSVLLVSVLLVSVEDPSNASPCDKPVSFIGCCPNNSSFCANTVSNSVGIPTVIKVNARIDD